MIGQNLESDIPCEKTRSVESFDFTPAFILNLIQGFSWLNSYLRSPRKFYLQNWPVLPQSLLRFQYVQLSRILEIAENQNQSDELDRRRVNEYKLNSRLCCHWTRFIGWNRRI